MYTQESTSLSMYWDWTSTWKTLRNRDFSVPRTQDSLLEFVEKNINVKDPPLTRFVEPELWESYVK